MRKSSDGLHLAGEDLKIRVPGELPGTKQSGLPELRAGNAVRQAVRLEQARLAAFTLLEGHPCLYRQERHDLLRAGCGHHSEFATVA